MKYVIITGGVISGLGKGITASSIGLLLKLKGLNVTAVKIDPYLNELLKSYPNIASGRKNYSTSIKIGM